MAINDYYINPPIYDSSFPIYIEKQEFNHSGSLFPIHWHEQLELIYILEGDFYMYCNQGDVVGRPGDLICINVNEIHHVQSRSNKTTYYCVVIDSLFIKSAFLDRCELEYISPLWNTLASFHNHVDSGSVKSHFEALIKEYNEKEKGYELAIKGYVQLIVGGLFRECLNDSNHGSNTLIDRKLDYVKVILKIIHEQYRQPLSIDYLSSNLHIGSYYLCHIFKEVTGSSVNQYIKSYRLNKSAIMLKTSTHTITEIALNNGFNDGNYFSRAFKKEFGVSPNHYRKL